jgi:hypothetical protein
MDEKWLLSSFWQTGNNCATIAVIKAAILQYGPDKIFTATPTNKVYLFKLQSQRTFEITDSKIAALSEKMCIEFDEESPDKKQLNDIKKCVSLCFAVMVTSLVEYGLRYKGKFYEYTKEEAIEELVEESFNPISAAAALGVKITNRHEPKNITIKAASLKKKKAVIIANNKHVAAMSYGWYDSYGDLKEWNKKWPRIEGKKMKYWYGLA